MKPIQLNLTAPEIRFLLAALNMFPDAKRYDMATDSWTNTGELKTKLRKAVKK